MISYLFVFALLTTVGPCLGADGWFMDKQCPGSKGQQGGYVATVGSIRGFIETTPDENTATGRYQEFLGIYDNEAPPAFQAFFFDYPSDFYQFLSSDPTLTLLIESVAGSVEQLATDDYTNFYQDINTALENFWSEAAAGDVNLGGADFHQRVVGVRAEILYDSDLMYAFAEYFYPQFSVKNLGYLAGLVTLMAEARNKDALLELVGGNTRRSPVVSVFYGDEALRRGAPSPSLPFDEDLQREVTHVYLFGFGLQFAINKTPADEFNHSTHDLLPPDEPFKATLFRELASGYFFGHSRGRNRDDSSMCAVFDFWYQRTEIKPGCVDQSPNVEVSFPNPAHRTCARIAGYNLAKADGDVLRSPLDLWNYIDENGLASFNPSYAQKRGICPDLTCPIGQKNSTEYSIS